MTIARARRDDVEIAHETFGSPPGAPLLLVMGVGAQMLYWHDQFCAALAERPFRVARFDNRDAGLSTHLSSAGAPGQLRMLGRPAAAYDAEMIDYGFAAVKMSLRYTRQAISANRLAREATKLFLRACGAVPPLERAVFGSHWTERDDRESRRAAERVEPATR